MAAVERPAAAATTEPEAGFPLSDASQGPTAGAGTKVLLRGARRGEECDVAARAIAG
jgi:hypothetical protein